MDKILTAVSSHLMAADLAILHDHKARTVERIICVNNPGLQSGCSCYRLEGRSRFIRVIDTAVSPHPVQQILLFLFTHSFRVFCTVIHKGLIQIKLRHICHGKDLPVLRVHHNDGHTVRLFCLHCLISKLCCIFLDIHIHGQHQIIAIHRFHPVFSGALQFNSPCIRHRKDRTGSPLQHILVFHLNSQNPLIVTAGKSQHLGGKLTARIVTLVVLVNLHTVQIIFPDPVSHFLIHIAFDPLNGGDFLYPLADIFLTERKFPAQHLHNFFFFLDLTVDHGNRTDRLIICKHIAVPIQDPPSRRLDIPLPLLPDPYNIPSSLPSDRQAARQAPESISDI